MNNTQIAVKLLASAALMAMSVPLPAQGQTASAGAPPANPEQKPSDALLAGFMEPGEAARPRVWWHWMNGNITADGVRKDMEWMNRVGIAGLQAFDAGNATPQVVEKRLPYMTDGWKAAFREAAVQAGRLDLELGIAASPGWSETGGPWVTAPDAMKKLAWSEMRLSGGQHFRGIMPHPPTTTGILQTSTSGWGLGGRAAGQNPPELYADQKVLALRVADAPLPRPIVTVSGGTLDSAALADGNIDKPAVNLISAREVGGESWVRFDYGRTVTIRGLTFATPLFGRFYDALDPRKPTPAPVRFRLDASDDGAVWHDTGAQVVPGWLQRTVSVNNARARYFRLVSIRQAPEAAPVPAPRFSRPAGPPPDVVPVNELVLRGEPTVHSFEEKAAFFTNGDYFGLPTGTAGPGAAPAGEVIDLTGRMSADGRLDWVVPKGEWVVLRMGYSLTGAMNRPASPEATGLEVDKLDPDAVKRYMDHYLGMYRDASGGLLGMHGVRAMMFDSWEASHENWTPKILEQFRRLRGYDPVPWLPALTGHVVDNSVRSDAFLFDWRRTLQQLLTQNHYELLTRMLHDNGMIRYGEGHEAVYATMGEGMEMKQSADIPMAAMWQAQRPAAIEPVYFNDIQESASVAHIYGQNIVATEALTGGPAYGSAPWDLKPTADAILLAGSNRFVIHTSAHQPVDRGPGMTLGVGQYFTRNETWAEQAKPWVDYLSRASFLLQQGRSASDVAVFYGETGSISTTYHDSYPAVPEGYRYDYVNADAVLDRLSPGNGKAVTATGLGYRMILLGSNAQRVTLPVLEKLAALVEGGVALVGLRPQGSPSLSDDPARVTALLDRLWPQGQSETRIGQGRVFASANAEEAVHAIGLPRDFNYIKPQADSNVMFIHRILGGSNGGEGGNLYFLSNRVDRAETITANFRVSGRPAELWDPATGQVQPANYRTTADGLTQVTIPLDRFGSVFVVFRGTGAPSHEAPQKAWNTLASLGGPWTVSFQKERGAVEKTVFPVLSDLRDNADPGIRYFSGIAAYAKSLKLPAGALANGRRVAIDLGDVGDLAEVWVNGKLAGTAWKPPYRVDVTGQVHAGANTVEIRAVNLWVNRLIGDVQPGNPKKITFTAADGKIDAATANSRSAQMPYKPDAPLRKSGLIGPVTVLVREL